MITHRLTAKMLILFAVCSFMSLNLLAAEGEQAVATAGAKIEVVTDTADFGEVKPKSTHSFVYQFKNSGSETLNISRVQSTCGCTVPELAKKDYAPGETGEIKITYTAASREGETVKHLYVHSNDASNPRYPLIVKSVTVLKASVEPAKFDLSIVKPNAGFTEFKVFSRDNTEFAIKDITVNGNPFKFNFDPNKKAKEHILMPVVDINKLKEFLTGVINIKIDHPECDTLTVVYNTLPQYSASPARIILQNAVPEEKQTREVWIKNNYGNSIEITGAKSDKGNITYELIENKDGMAKLNLTIAIPPKSGQSRYFTEDLVINIKDADDMVIKTSGWYLK